MQHMYRAQGRLKTVEFYREVSRSETAGVGVRGRAIKALPLARAFIARP